MFGGVDQLVRSPTCHVGGCRFEPGRPRQLVNMEINRQITILVEPNPTDILNSFATELFKKDGVCVMTATQENINKIASQDIMSSGANMIVYLGENERDAALISNCCVTTGDVILFKEVCGNYSEDQAEELFKVYYNISYDVFKNRHIIKTKNKFEKITRLWPELLNAIRSKNQN